MTRSYYRPREPDAAWVSLRRQLRWLYGDPDKRLVDMEVDLERWRMLGLRRERR